MCLATAGWAAAASIALPAAAADQLGVHAEVDPLPFVLSGYGGQIGLRPVGLGGVRFAFASFSLDAPDPVVQLGGNNGFHARVLPSAALYVLYYPTPTEDGWAFGGAMRYLRLRYSHDNVAGSLDVAELSPELIGGYQWHPLKSGLYLQPWLGLSATLWRNQPAVLGDVEYSPLPVQAFATVNIGFETAL